MFRRILAATDIITDTDGSTTSALSLARQQNARLFLLHVMESASTQDRRRVRHFQTHAETMADDNYARKIEETLQNTYAHALSEISHELKVTTGYPWEEILRWADRIDPDLIVLGPHSTRAEEKGVVRIAGQVGSTAEKVITRAPCPVMVVKHALTEERFYFERVLVAVDFSRSCECAVCFAAEVARRYRSQLFLFHMLPVPPFPKYSRANYLADKTHATEKLQSFYEKYMDGIDHQYRVRAGALPHLAIVDFAREYDVGLIVMGSHTKIAAGKWYPGSAVERVAYRALCPEVVITDPQALIHWNVNVGSNGEESKDRLIHLFSGEDHAA